MQCLVHNLPLLLLLLRIERVSMKVLTRLMSKEVAPVAAGIRIIIKTKQEKPLAELRAAARDPKFELQKMNPKL
jgi:hypothetical protein